MALSPVTTPGRSITETLRLVELAVWTVGVVGVAALLCATLVGAFVVSSRPLGPGHVALLAAVVVGTLAFVAAEFVFE
jgi:ABC-type proline/glycine betaine transport system permease subunit